MEVSNNIQPKTVTIRQFADNKKHAHNPSFGNFIVATMDAIERGGFAAAFVVQDTCGMTLPRTYAGFLRNKDITGQYNEQEAAEVFIREFVSGSSMVTVPMVMLWGIKRAFGKANDVPVDMIQVLGKRFEKTLSRLGVDALADNAEMKKAFYADVFKNILKNAYDELTPDKVIDDKALDFAERLIKAESSKPKTIWQRLRATSVPTSSDEILGRLGEEFAEIRKGGISNASSNFTHATVSNGTKTVEKNLSKVMADMRNFVEDILKTASKKSDEVAADASGFVQRFTSFRSGSRVLVNASMLAGLIGFCSCIPKLYQLSDKNPGLNGLPNSENQEQSANIHVENNGKSKKPSFKGAEKLVYALGDAAAKEGGFISKLAKPFEFDSYNTSIMTFLTACTFGIIWPRMKNAREENEYKEVVFRDVTTVGTVMFAAKALQNIFSEFCTKVSGFALNKKRSGERNLASRLFDYLKPTGGVHVMTSSDLASHYTNIDKYRGGVAGFMRFVDEQGGDIRKMFASNKKAEAIVKELYNIRGNNTTIPYEAATNANIIKAVEDAKVVLGGKEKLKELAKFFENNSNNTFLKKAKFMNSGFNFLTLFMVVPVLLGWVIPRFNEKLTKQRELEKHKSINEAPSVPIAQTVPVKVEFNNKTTNLLDKFTK